MLHLWPDFDITSYIFLLKKLHTPKFTYRLLKSSVYIINQIRDLTNSYDMPRSRSQWLFLEKTLSLL